MKKLIIIAVIIVVGVLNANADEIRSQSIKWGFTGSKSRATILKEKIAKEKAETIDDKVESALKSYKLPTKAKTKKDLYSDSLYKGYCYDIKKGLLKKEISECKKECLKKELSKEEAKVVMKECIIKHTAILDAKYSNSNKTEIVKTENYLRYAKEMIKYVYSK